ncbi:MAG: hypothetical protein RJA11_937 [Bacteroidota bacterium]|jgi:hypothetical protein
MKNITAFIVAIVMITGLYAVTEAPDIIIRPGEPIAYFSPEEEGVIMEVTVLNKGGETLQIKEVKSSCFCASAIVNNPSIRPMGKGKLTFQVSTSRMLEDSVTRVDFTVISNAKNASFSIPLLLVNKKFLKDSKN